MVCMFLLHLLFLSSCDDSSIPVSAARIEAIRIVNTCKNGSGAFGGCAEIREITLPFVGKGSGFDSGDKYHFGRIFGTNQKFSDKAEKTEQTSSNSVSANPKYWIPASVKQVRVMGGEIGFGAFNGCGCIESVMLDDDVSSIGQWAFHGCIGLKSIALPSSIASLAGYQCFADCISLESIIIPESCAQIGSGAFAGLSALASSWALDIFLKSSSNTLPPGFESGWNRRDSSFEHRYYAYSESEPVSTGGLWHYVDGKPTIW
ncbi:MAG TPA: hypothetical protein DCO86_01915 [Spirochaetaceae bacterium]|nr:hypothetical protein [Spirochaetaceae bacterium]